MKTDFLNFYESELSFMKKHTLEFAEANPKIANHLRINSDSIEDPHISCMMESFAFLTARIQQKLSDDFTEVSRTLLEQIYPHYLLPIPSMSIVQMQGAKEEHIPRSSLIETKTVDNENCQFQTCYPVDIFPIEIVNASFSNSFSKNVFERYAKAESKLTVNIQTKEKKLQLSELPINKIRLYINLPSPQNYRLYEYLFKQCLGIELSYDAGDGVVRNNAVKIQAVGFDEDEGLLPYPEQSALEHRLLSEYFVFPQKFMFFDIIINDKDIANINSSELAVSFYFDRSEYDLEDNISYKSLLFGATPIINLFEKTAEPITLNHQKSDYIVIPDVNARIAMQVYSINHVSGIDKSGNSMDFIPYFSPFNQDKKSLCYQTQRMPKNLQNQSTDVFLRFYDGFNNQNINEKYTVSVDTLSFQEGLVTKIPNMQGQSFQFVDMPGNFEIKSIVPLTNVIDPNLENNDWQLISHLSLNYLSFSDFSKNTELLKMVLRLYDRKHKHDSLAIINSVSNLKIENTVSRISVCGVNSVLNGVEIEVELDKQLIKSETFLFGQVLNFYLSKLATINCFTQLAIRYKGDEEIWHKWQPKIGYQQII